MAGGHQPYGTVAWLKYSRSGFAADYVAPTYLPFVIDIIKEAKEQHIDYLQFLSRDGVYYVGDG